MKKYYIYIIENIETKNFDVVCGNKSCTKVYGCLASFKDYNDALIYKDKFKKGDIIL